MGIVDECLAVLASNRRSEFLAELVHWLAIGARASYVQAGESTQSAAEALQCCNEVMIVATAQLGASLKGAQAYPDRDFMFVVREKSQGRACESQIRWALKKALEVISFDSPHI